MPVSIYLLKNHIIHAIETKLFLKKNEEKLHFY